MGLKIAFVIRLAEEVRLLGNFILPNCINVEDHVS